MIRRLRSLASRYMTLLVALEGVLISLFFVQALRYLIANLYAHIASASLYPALDPRLIDPDIPGLVEPATLSGELTLLSLMLLLPLLSLLIGRFSGFVLVGVIVSALGRLFLIDSSDLLPAAVTVGGALFYFAMIVQHRARVFPTMIVLALALDQVFRAAGNTVDPTLSSEFESIQLILSAGVILLALLVLGGQSAADPDLNNEGINPDRGLMPVWGGLGLGAFLFLEMSLLSLPNAILGRSQLDYADYVWVAPALVVVTILPVVPWVRAQMRSFIGLFDSSVRGWSWMLLLMFLLVLGIRLGDLIGGISLIAAQFVACMLVAWMVRPRAARERHYTGFWLLLSVLIFALLVIMDIFTYEYAFVRDFSEDFAFLNDIIPPLLRGFRDLGIAILLLAAFVAVLPMAQTRRRIAWQGGSPAQSLLIVVVLVGGLGALTYVFVQPPVVPARANPESLRIGTYNIHSGYNEFFYSDLDAIAGTIGSSGANVILLQEAEVGRMTSAGVDQVLWLARELKMDARFYPTIEGLQGLAVLSTVPIVFDDGVLLDSVGSQTGLQRVQILPDEGVITLYNTWLDPLLDTGGSQETQVVEASQQNQLNQIFGIVREHHPDGVFGRMIIGGTFNNVPGSDVMRRLSDNGLIDHFAGSPLEITATFWRTGQRARLDYLWTTPNINMTGFGVMNTSASDHRLAFIGIDLR